MKCRLFARRGFTLVELLVVIGVIALLISILLPALTKAKKQAQLTADLSNIHQVGLAMLIYSADNKQHMLPAENAREPMLWLLDTSWAQLTSEYKIPAQAYGCNTFQDIKPYWSTFGLYQTNWHGTGYSVIGWNYFGGRVPNGTDITHLRTYVDPVSGQTLPFNVATAYYDKHASSQVLLTCMVYNAATPAVGWESVGPHFNGTAIYIPAGSASKWKSLEGLNAAFLDGHASWVPYRQLAQLTNPYGDWVYFPTLSFTR